MANNKTDQSRRARRVRLYRRRPDPARRAAIPRIEITALIAKGHAGQSLAQVFPHLASLDLPALVSSDEVDWDEIDVVFCGLPHGTAHSEIGKLPKRIKIIDMSADFRLRDPKLYAEWYANEHSAPELLKEAVYGLTEHYRDQIKDARLVACPGCYPTAVLLALLPLAKAKLIARDRHHHRRQVRRLRRRAARSSRTFCSRKRARGSRLTASAITATCRRSSRSWGSRRARP